MIRSLLSTVFLIFVLPFLFSGANASQRLDSLLQILPEMESDQQIMSYLKILDDLLLESPESGEEYLKQLFQYASQTGNKRLIALSRYQEARWLDRKLDKKPAAITLLIKTLEYTRSNNLSSEEVDLLMELGIVHWFLDYKDKAWEYYLEATDVMRKHEFKNITLAGDYLAEIGGTFYRAGYYERAIEYFKVFEENPKLTATGITRANLLNTIGLSHKKLKNYGDALRYFNMSLQIAESENARDWIGLMNGNIGSVYYEMGDWNKAIPLLEKDISLSLETGLHHRAASASELLADLYFKKGEIEKALTYYTNALEIDKNSPNIALQRNVYEDLSTLYSNIGKNDKALESFRQFTILQDSIQKGNKVEELKRLEVRFNFEKEDQARLKQIEALQIEKQMIINKQRATIVGAVLILSLVAVVFYANRQRMVKNRELLKQELEFNKRKLDLELSRLIQKTNLVEDLQQQIEALTNSAGRENDEKNQLLNQLFESTILTDADWSEFKKIFGQVHRGFFARLHQSYHDLTEGETRLMTLVKLNLSAKEIGNMLGISADSVNKSRYRLRKKLSIEGEVNLEEFIAKV